MAILNYYKIGKVIPQDAVYIGRGNQRMGLPNSPLANPFPITESEPRDVVIKKYHAWLWKEIKDQRVSMDYLESLHGKDLVCYCAPKPCHGDIILKAIDWALLQKRIQNNDAVALNSGNKSVA